MVPSLTTITGHTSSVWTSSFSRDGSCLATCSSDKTARMWSILQQMDNSKCPPLMTCLNDHTSVVRGCGFSPDSSLLATCSWDKQVLIYSTSDFLVKSKLLAHQNGVGHVQFSPCGHILVSCGWDARIGVWDVQTGTLLHWLAEHCSPVSSCTFLPAALNGTTVMASCSWDGTVKVWDLSQSRGALFTLQNHPDAVYAVNSNPTNTNLLASCGRKASFILWDLRAQSFHGSGTDYMCRVMAWNYDAQSCCQPNSVPWQVLENGGWIEFTCVCFPPNGARVLVGDSMGQIHTWDMTALQACPIATAQSNSFQAHASSVTDLTFSSDGSLLSSCSTDHTCCIWDHSSVPPESSVDSLADYLGTQLSLNAK